MRKLASIQKIKSVSSIENADLLELAEVLGWRCVVKKGEFAVGDLVIYVEYDSVLPEKPEFEFLRSKHFRIKTCRFRGAISQGICFPLSLLPEKDYSEGEDVTELLGVTKYEPPVKGNPSETKGNFPPFIPKTDEVRIQTIPEILTEDRVLCYATLKLDGTSATYYSYGCGFGACSRNLELKKVEGNKYWRIVEKYDLERRLLKMGNFAIQGEIVGEGIQHNKYKLKGIDFYLFNVFDIIKGERLNFFDMCEFAAEIGVKTVPILQRYFIPQLYSLDELINLSDFDGGEEDIFRKPVEGIVIRSITPKYSNTIGGDYSFKVINPKFLLKHDE